MQTKKIISRTALVLFVLVVSGFAFETVGYFLQVGASGKVRTLLFAKLPIEELPEQVVMNIDGHQATYVKGSASYNQLLDLFRLKYSEEVVLNAGACPPIRTGVLSGDIMIHYFDLPYHFKVIRSLKNPNYFWMELPDGNGRPGIAYPVFIDNNQLGGFVRATAEQTKTTSNL